MKRPSHYAILRTMSFILQEKKGRKLPTEETSHLTCLGNWCRKFSLEDILEELLLKEEN